MRRYPPFICRAEFGSGVFCRQRMNLSLSSFGRGQGCGLLSVLFPDQRDVDQPLVRVGDLAMIGAASDGDCECRSFIEVRFALGRGVDLPLLAVAGADDEAPPLGDGAGWALGQRHPEKGALAARARDRSRRDDKTAVVGHGGNRVDGVSYNPRESPRRDEEGRQR